MFTLAFWKGAAERGIKTFAQSLLGSIVVTATIQSQDWITAFGVAGTATAFSLLTSLASADFVAGTPATTGAETAIGPDAKAE